MTTFWYARNIDASLPARATKEDEWPDATIRSTIATVLNHINAEMEVRGASFRFGPAYVNHGYTCGGLAGLQSASEIIDAVPDGIGIYEADERTGEDKVKRTLEEAMDEAYVTATGER